LPASDEFWNIFEALARFDFADDIQSGGDMGDICGAHRVPIASRSWERWKVAIRQYGVSQHSTSGEQQIDRFSRMSGDLRGLLFDHATRIFEAQGDRWNWVNGHEELMIEDDWSIGASAGSLRLTAIIITIQRPCSTFTGTCVGACI
jgi:hypothetical protein